jgi:hypothetical protein
MALVNQQPFIRVAGSFIGPTDAFQGVEVEVRVTS